MSSPEALVEETSRAKPGSRMPSLYVQVLVGIAFGALLGWARPAWAVELKPLGDVIRAADQDADRADHFHDGGR